jgi:thermitase
VKLYLKQLALGVFTGAAVISQAQDYVPGEVIVRTRDGKAPIAVQVGVGSNEALIIPQLGVRRVKFTGSTVEAMVKMFKADPNVLYAEPNYIQKKFHIPNDPLFSQQYGHTNVRSTKAWDIFRGSPSSIIAVIDDGLRLTHEEFVGRLATGGFDFSSDDNDPSPEGSDTHGTHTSGIAAAATNNGVGVASVAYNSRVLPIKIFPNSFASNSARAIIHAADNGARVISMSYGSYNFSQVVQDAVNYAWGRNVVLFGASGNDDLNRNTFPSDNANVITVGSTTRTDSKSDFSNWGPWVEIAAPGTDIRSTISSSNSSYGDLSGTSMACPFAASVAGLMVARNPSLTNAKIRDILFSTADPVGSWVTKGRVNAEKAIIAAAPFVAFNSTPVTADIGVNGGIAEGTLLSAFGSSSQAASSVASVDTATYNVLSKTFKNTGNIASVDALVRVTAPRTLIRTIGVEVTASAPSPVSSIVFLYNFKTAAWEQAGSMGMSPTEKTSMVNLAVTNIGNYMNSSGHFRVYLRAVQPARIKGGDFTLVVNRVAVVGLYDPTAAP